MSGSVDTTILADDWIAQCHEDVVITGVRKGVSGICQKTEGEDCSLVCRRVISSGAIGWENARRVISAYQECVDQFLTSGLLPPTQGK
jgi:hypothetical protein